jgi:6-phosphogluconolactonase (cycloisomerase 2 family)
MSMSHQNPRISSRQFLTLLLSALILTATAFAQTGPNVVYVESNVGKTASKNSIYAYSNSNGKLTQLKGSPFLTGGTGVFSSTPSMAPGFMADQEVVVNSAGTLLFAVNGHSNTITTFTIKTDGTLAVASSVGSSGQDPVSLGLAENSEAGEQMTVVNQNADPGQTGGTPNITSFDVSSAGVLTMVKNSTIDYPTGSEPSQALPSPSGKFNFVTQFMGGGALASYDITAGGLLLLNNSLIPSKGTNFLGANANAKQRSIYVGLPDVNMVGAYTYSTAGVLAFSKLTVNPGLQVGWLTSNPKATVLYTAEPSSNSVTVYMISGANFTKPKQLQHLTLKAGGEATNLKLDPTGAFLYVLGLNNPPGGTGNFLHVLNVSATDGTLTETLAPVSIPVASGEIPMGLAVALK